MAVTIADIAKDADVSIATVSRSLNQKKDPYISDRTRNKIILAAKKLGYRPNRFAKALATGKSHTLMYWSPSSQNPYYAEVSYYLHNFLKPKGYDSIHNELPEHGGKRLSWEGLFRWPVDGIIITEGVGVVENQFSNIVSGDVPVVSFGELCFESTDNIYVDFRPAINEVISYFDGLGKKRIAYCCWGKTDVLESVRSKAYIDFVSEQDVKPEFIFTADNSREASRKEILKYVKANGCPGAIIFHNDDMAIGGFSALHDLGISIPKDVMIVGCDGIKDIEYFRPTISTIRQPYEEICDMAWKYVQNRLKCPEIPKQECTVYPKFVSLNSTCANI